jgi:hypothetical protein
MDDGPAKYGHGTRNAHIVTDHALGKELLPILILVPNPQSCIISLHNGPRLGIRIRYEPTRDSKEQCPCEAALLAALSEHLQPRRRNLPRKT